MAVGDIGLLVWVGVVVLGVMSSIISATRRRSKTRVGGSFAQPQRAASPQTASRRDERAGQRAPILQASTSPTVGPLPGRLLDVPAETPLVRPASAHRTSTKGLFGDRRSLIRGIVAAQVLGKPGGLSDEY